MRHLVPALVLTLLFSRPTEAQERRATVELTVGPTLVNFEDFGGFPGAVAHLSLSRSIAGLIGGEVSGFAVGVLGAGTAIPDCIPGGSCRTYSTPNAYAGLIAALLVGPGELGLRGSLGASLVTAMGSEGYESSGLGAVIGLDWIAPSGSAHSLVLKLRVVRFASDIGGSRQLLLPGIGFRF